MKLDSFSFSTIFWNLRANLSDVISGRRKSAQKGIMHLLLHDFISVRVDDILFIWHMKGCVDRNKAFAPR